MPVSICTHSERAPTLQPVYIQPTFFMDTQKMYISPMLTIRYSPIGCLLISRSQVRVLHRSLVFSLVLANGGLSTSWFNCLSKQPYWYRRFLRHPVSLGFQRCHSLTNKSYRSSIPRGQPPPTALIGGFICTFFAPHCQSIFVPASFVKLTLRLPLLASTAPLLFHTINNPMALLIAEVFSWLAHTSSVTLAGIFTLALSTPITQSIFVSLFLVKLALVLPLFASGALLHSCPLTLCFAFDFGFFHKDKCILQSSKWQYSALIFFRLFGKKTV